ncbi:MAG: thioredoxin domain-containing protein [Cyanobacteria bacterium P01_F01_bin.150]
MTHPSASHQSVSHQSVSHPFRSRWISIALILGFAVVTFILTHPQTNTLRFSTVSGLMTLKESAKTAMPYDIAMANQKPTLIEFYADWCTTCQGLAPTLAMVDQKFGPDLNMVMLDIDNPQWRSQIKDFQVNGVPHLILLDTDHRVMDTFVGNISGIVLRDRVVHLLDRTI